MFVACGIWCLADVSSVSPSSEQTGELSSYTALLLVVPDNAYNDRLPCSYQN